MKRPQLLRGLFCLLCGALATSPLAADEKPAADDAKLPAPAKQTIDFVRDVKPLLARSCYSCHGAEMHEGGLRLNRKADALAGGDSGKAILPGRSAESRLVQYVSGVNEDGVLMPPEGEGTRLTEGEVAILRAWIDQGAKWPAEADEAAAKSEHWAFQPIARPTLPPVKNLPWGRNPIDDFVLARLEAEGIEPAPEADRATLLRRASLDLLGLPPSPQEVEAFLRDTSENAYERAVDRMLESPHYGERWARHWLDLARYADSDGYEKDKPRPHAWRYREWVIYALNRDLPFDRFTIEQLAGDLLPGATVEQKVATGFHRNTLTNREGGIDPEEDRVKQTVDRVNTTGAVWLGLTIGCGQCHSHKYDPISQREYYGFYAFFNSLQEVDIPAPLSGDDDAYQKAKLAFDQEQARLKAAVVQYINKQLPARQQAWERTAAATQAGGWRVLKPVSVESAGGATLKVLDDGSVLASGKNPAADTYTVSLHSDLSGITGLRLEALPDDSLPAKGPGRVKHGNFVLSELRLATCAPGAEGKAEPVPLERAVADFSQGQDMQEWPVAAAIDGDTATGWAIAPQFGRRHVAVFETKEDVSGSELTLTLDQQYGSQHTIGRFRVAVTADKRPLSADGLPDAVRQALAKEAENRSAAEKKAVADYYRTIDPELARLNAAVAAHAKKAPQRTDKTMAQTLAELSTPRETHLLIRGDFLQPGDPVERHTPAVLPPLKPEGERPTRLDLARWIVSPENPLTARVTVNRVWQRYFGRGIVGSSHDFGTQGDEPSHPKLLDWLASEFMAEGWSLKKLHRLIVTSATYRQSSRERPELTERDPYNKLLARQNRLRVEAEVVRDLALAASGLLHPEVGGPSVRPPQPEGIDKLGYAGAVRWKTSTGADRYRRGLYTFFQRTVPYPMFMDFDAPDSNVVCTRRERSNTPIAALTLQNDPVFVECAQAFARRVLTEVECSDKKNCDLARRVNFAFQAALARRPEAEERGAVTSLYKEALEQFEAQPQLATAMAGKLPKPEGAGIAEIAAWTVVGRTLMNVDEFITRE